jgi:hypothetical protein
LTQKQLKDLRQLHAAMGHLHPDGMVKAIEAKAVVIPQNITVQMVKQYGKLAEGCAPCLTAVTVAANMKGLPFKSHIIPGLALNKMYSPGTIHYGK